MTLVVFVFLGSPRSVLIPTVAIPLSLIGTFTMMLAFGFSINLLTLLALVLAIGLVVDDAIIVVENVNRHLEEGMTPIAAAIQAARELGGPIIAMTVVLIAVYVPIGFQSGLTGALFTEFAFTLVGAVTVSAIIALTLVADDVLASSASARPRGRGWARSPDRLHRPRFRAAAAALRSAGCMAVSTYLPVTDGVRADRARQHLFPLCAGQSELAPQEDQGVVITSSTPAPECDAAADADLYHGRSTRLSPSYPETGHVFQLDMPGPGHRRHGAEAVGPAHASTTRRCCNRSCSRSGDRSPARASWRSSRRRCRAAGAARPVRHRHAPSRSSG